jgi:hypothetical protein
MVDLGRLATAVATSPLVPVQNSAAQHRMDAALGRVGGSRVPVQKRVGS